MHELIRRDENIENGVDFKFILVSTAPRIDFHMKTEVSLAKVNEVR